MGAERFDTFQMGTEVGAAFSAAHEQACYDYGHAGYSGTLAEKTEFVLRASGGPLTRKDAEEFADRDMEENDHDKWGPAWAVAVRADDSPNVIGYLFYGYASS